MAGGEEIIYQGVLRDAETRTWGSPDFLVRSDVLQRLFPRSLSEEGAAMGAPDLDAGWHYRIVDSKFATLTLLAGGDLGNTGSAPAYKVQVFIYNRALGRLQGYEPPEAFLLGRGWQQRIRGETTRVLNCMDRLAPVSQDYASPARGSLTVQAEQAAAWLRLMRKEGGKWDAAPEPTVDELRVNAKADSAPWSAAVGEILQQTEDLTVLYQVGPNKRAHAIALGVSRWREHSLSSETVGVTGDTLGPRLQALLDVNREAGSPPVQPERVQAARDVWIDEPSLEFYVDFETVSSLDDDFSRLPDRGGQELIFMIGCGHLEEGDWSYTCFVADRLNESNEADAINRWFAHMRKVRERLGVSFDPLVVHWSPAEPRWLERDWYAAFQRHRQHAWPSPNWFDFLGRVVREEPVVVRGAHGFGLKELANAMQTLGLIDAQWRDGPADGLGAMVGAWWCETQAAEHAQVLLEFDLMREIRAYNEVDCRAMMEIVRYLRAHH